MKFLNRIQKCTATIWLLFFLIIANSNFISVSGAPGQQDEIPISGLVADANSNEPLPGVSIIVKGTSVGTVTDMNGKYSINVPYGASLQFSCIGYLKEEFTIRDETELSVKLVPDIIGLEEIVVVGYGIQKKSDVTGSIASVSSEKITEVPVSGIDHALQGRASGVNIITKSGRPGEDATIQIRGITSINAGSPLLIVDDIPGGSLAGINANDIESIEILKDASSAAIYGVSGGNGVIIVTTKKGQQGKLKTNFNFYTGIENSTRKLDLMNSQQLMQWFEETQWEGSSPRNRDTIATTGRIDTLPTYDWQGFVFEPSHTQNYDLTMSGGSENSTFLISANYFKQDGIIRNSDYQRYTLRIKSDHKLLKRIKFSQNSYYVNTNTDGFDWQFHEYYNSPIIPALLMPPMVPDYNEDGTWANSDLSGNSNPLAMMDMINRKAKTNDISTNISVDIEILKGLIFKSRFFGNMGFDDTKEFQDVYYNTTTDRRDKNKLLGRIDRSLDYTAQQLLSYNFSLLNNHNITLLAGMEYSRNRSYYISGERDSLPSPLPAMQFFSTSYDREAPSQIIQGGGEEGRKLSYFTRLNYDYKGKWLLTANLRRDGVHNLHPRQRIGYFPSISGGWKFSEEEFMQSQGLISFGKIRIGYGEMGAFPRTDYPYLSLVRTPSTLGYSFDNSDVSSVGAAVIQIENPDIKWETVRMTNVGIDLAFFQNRLSVSAEYYNKVNEDMIMDMETPYITGTYSMGADFDGSTTYPEVNVGSIRNSGFEFNLGYKKMVGNLKGSFDLNFSTLKNKVLDLAADSLTRGSIHWLNPINLTRIGGSVSEFWGWETDGIFTESDPFIIVNDRKIITNQAFRITDQGDTVYAQRDARPGDARFKDVNGDGRVLTDQDKVSLGSPLPKFIFGFSINLEYKNFDFSAFFNGAYGNKILNGIKQYLYYRQDFTNHAADFANRYVENDIYKYDPVTGERFIAVPANHNTTVFRDDSKNYSRPTDFYVEDGSYLRLKILNLGYTIPAALTSKINIQKFRVYVGIKNLFTITKYQGYNPEAGYTSEDQNLDMGIDIGVYPVTRMYLIGVNLNF